MRVINDSDLKDDLYKWLNTVVDDVEEIIIKRNNNEDVVLISLKEYNALKETNYLLKGNNRNRLLNSIKEAENGNFVEHKLIEE